MSVIITKMVNKLEPAIKKKAFAFLEKLSENDALPGLHIEPINNSADSRARTGRVDQGYRAVLFKLTTSGSVDYVFHGIWPHDEAIEVAKSAVLALNPISGVPEITAATTVPAGTAAEATPSPTVVTESDTAPSLLGSYGFTAKNLVDDLGLDVRLADRALAAPDEDGLLSVAGSAAADWQGLALVELASGSSIDDIKASLGLSEKPNEDTDSDEAIVRGLKGPAGQMSFAWIESNEELERVITEGDFGAWRVFLHPEQRAYVDKNYNGPARLSGGAGTGKTVVVLHRARALVRRQPTPRVLVTTYTTNLAKMLARDLRRLDPDLPMATTLGQHGAFVVGIDALAARIVKEAGLSIATAAESILGVATTEVSERTPHGAWTEAIAVAGQSLPTQLKSSAFFEEEYSAIVLPNRIVDKAQYLKVRRQGRGVALDRAKRTAVWDVIASYRATGRIYGRLDFDEVAALAAEWLNQRAAAGHNQPFDHVLVDEGQDLSPTRWQLLRAAVGEGPDDIFISEDSHQRIYGHRITLSQYGIRVVGRSRKLRLNYRTTAENLRWAMSVLDGGSFSDLEGEDEDHGYRSARKGPPPQLIRCGSLGDELDAVAATLKEWLKEGAVAPENVAVLVRDRSQQERVVNGLAERGVTVRSVDNEAIRPGQPVVMTMHRSKGTEFAKVVLFGVREGSIPAALRDQNYDEAAKADALLRERSLLYVAATRARDVLAVTWSGSPSPLIQD
ncbi:UvrD-helicase domain-containing protein [Pedococcus sp. 5OH_020]|uniref:UvrD-helicase domain-containing protein n=1 Tax=Pedococcus sp. 5OH_020 TaxID=2989814 RepID=UPI0022E9E78E|nr:UvrD-helicase domain-containing protein [Pedococcus sp. 5OH_020]